VGVRRTSPWAVLIRLALRSMVRSSVRMMGEFGLVETRLVGSADARQSEEGAQDAPDT
jgi:hypothetical protein